MTPWLTDPEIDDLCAGLQRNDAKVRHLSRMGLVVHTKPNGRPLVMRTHADAVLSGLQQIKPALDTANIPARPNRAALIAAFGKVRAA